MDKRYLNGALIVLLIIIWGTVIYKFFGKPKEVAMVNQTGFLNADYSSNYAISKDTFNLILTNKNPFKASSKNTVKKKIIKEKKIVNPKTGVKKKVIYPTITYHGFVKGENKTTRLILLKINNRLYKKREKETINDVTIVKAFSDSLIISFDDNLKTIKKIHDKF